MDPLTILIRVPHKQVARVMSSFWRDFNAFAQFLYTYVPLLTTFTLKQKERVFSCFVEDHFNPHQVIMRERTPQQHVYLIAEGQVKIVTQFNPFTQKYNKQKGLTEDCEAALSKNASGIGSLSRTINENLIGLVQSGQWLGEEIVLMNAPLIYSAVAVTDVKLFKVSLEDFRAKIPPEIHTVLERKAFEKLAWIRQRLEQCH